MSERPLRVLCVDDHQFLGEGLRTRLALEPDLEYAGWLGTAEGLQGEVERTRADVVLMDIEMPGPDPFEVLADLLRACPEVRVLMFSAYVKDHFIDAALDAGAWGYLCKGDDPQEVIEAIRAVRRGEFAFGATVLKRCRPAAAAGTGGPREKPASKLSRLTPREVQILRLIGRGLSRTEIAEMIHRSPKTVDNHRAAIMEKLDLNDRVELARFAIREGLVEP